jgi:hypothetical protein
MSDRLVDRLLSEQLADGGWNCEAERGSVRSSFHTTVCVLEGLLAFEKAFGSSSTLTDARQRAEQYLLARRLLRRLSSGEMIDPLWTRFAFPTLWHYDVLRALDYVRAAGIPPDPRVTEAIGIVLDRRQADGRWLLDVRHRDTLYSEFAGGRPAEPMGHVTGPSRPGNVPIGSHRTRTGISSRIGVDPPPVDPSTARRSTYAPGFVVTMPIRD